MEIHTSYTVSRISFLVKALAELNHPCKQDRSKAREVFRIPLIRDLIIAHIDGKRNLVNMCCVARDCLPATVRRLWRHTSSNKLPNVLKICLPVSCIPQRAPQGNRLMISFVSHILVNQERRSLYKTSVIQYETFDDSDLFDVAIIRKDLPRMKVLIIYSRPRYWRRTALYVARVDFSHPDVLPTLDLKLYHDNCVNNTVNRMIDPPGSIWPVSEFRLISLHIEHKRHYCTSLYEQSLELWAEYVETSHKFDRRELQAHLTEFSDFDSIFQHLEVFVLGSAEISYVMLHQILDAARGIKRLIVLVERGSEDQRRLLIDRLDDFNTLADLGFFFSEAVFDDLPYNPATGIPIPAFPKAYRRQLRTLRCFVDPYAIAREHQDVHNRGRCPGLRLSNVQNPAPLFTLELYLKYRVELPNPEAFACALRQHLPRGIYVKIIAAGELIQWSQQLGQEVVVRLHEGSDMRDAFIQWTNDLLPQPYIAPKRGMTAGEGRSDPLGEETTRGEADGCWLQ